MSIVGILLLLNLLFISTNGLRMTFQETLDEPTAPSTQQNDADLKWAQLEFLNEPPEKRRGHTTIVLGSELLVFGGCYLDQKCFNDLHSFDTRTKVWTSQRINGIPPSQREGHSVAVVGSKMYLFGGSGSSSYYNDLFIFDLESKTWLEVNYQGPKPTPRSNHGAVVDKKGRIIIFGGFTENGYSNDIFIMDPAEEKWEKPFVSGQAPVPRENFSITRVRNTIWIFGGFTDGGVLGDLNILDLDSMAWNAVETFGTKPPGRQGHGAIVHEKNFMMFGGCNYKIKDCYSDMYYLDIDSLWWKKISDDKTEKFKPRESFSTNVIGAMIYVFGGCKLYEECYNDVLAYNTNIPCPNSCSNNGECRNEQCVCSQGYFDNDCSLSIKCKDDCNGHGECRSNGKCACFSGFTGESCDTTVNCPNNCTSSDRGICLSTGQCKCFSGFSGDSCESGTAVAMACPKDCSKHGECDKRTGICVCEKFYTGDDCSKSIDDIQLTDAKLGVKAQELAEQNMIDSATTIEQVREEIQEQIAAQRIEEEEKLHEGEGTDGLKALEERKADEDEDEFLDEGEEDLGYGGPLESGSQEVPPQEPSAETGTTEGVTSESSETTETAETTETTETQEGSEISEENAEEELGEYGLEDELESLMQRAAREGKTSESSSEGLVTIGEQPSSIALLDASLQQSTTTGSSSGSANTTNASDTTRNSLEEQLRGGGVQRTTTQTTTETETDDEQFENTAVENLTPEMFADAYSKERKLQQKKILATDAESSMCPNSCSHNGLCRGDTCYCSNGYTGEDCSISNVQDLKEGETVEKLLKYAGACFVIGAVIGIFLIVALIRKAQESEYMNIQPKVEEED